MCSGDSHFAEKTNGIKYLYAWLDRHPDVCLIVIEYPESQRAVIQ